jgi:Fe-S-cluster-containing hydrogenase component 2
MIRKIITIDEEKCNGCGACAQACHEGAIGMVEGKAKLLRDDYCDGLGDCLPVCPTNAITFVEREAAAYNEEAVLENKEKKSLPCGCPGTHSRSLVREKKENIPLIKKKDNETQESMLSQWPVQIKLVPVKAPYFDKANLLVAATCSAYAYNNFHSDFIVNRVTLVGCPKLDAVDYSEKLSEILINNDIKSLTLVRMEVPCCGGLEIAVKKAMENSKKWIPWQVITISTEGKIIE